MVLTSASQAHVPVQTACSLTLTLALLVLHFLVLAIVGHWL